MSTPRILQVALLLFLMWTTGCATAPAFRAHPDWETRKKSIHSVLVVPANIQIIQVTAGGVREEMDEWSLQARDNLTSALIDHLQTDHGVSAKAFSEEGLPDDVAANLRQTRALFDAVNVSVVTHTYGHKTVQFAEKLKTFDYTLGEETSALAAGQADAILMVWGREHVLSAGNVTRQIATGVVLGLLTGVVPIQQGTAYVSMALVDANTGSVLWFRHMNTQQGGGTYHLRDPQGAASIVRLALRDFAIGGSNDQKAQ